MGGGAGAQMNLATVGVLHVAMALEDPFDNQGLDGIYVDEALFEAEQVRLVPCLSAVTEPRPGNAIFCPGCVLWSCACTAPCSWSASPGARHYN